MYATYQSNVNTTRNCSYGPTIFRQLGFIGTRNALFANGVYGSVRFVVTVFFGLFVIDKIGRRKPLIFGCFLLSGCLFFIGLYLTINGVRSEGEARQAGDYVAITYVHHSVTQPILTNPRSELSSSTPLDIRLVGPNIL